MCEFFTKATRRRFGRVRGFKQKFFACNADLHDKLCAYAKAPRRESALDSCLRPASTPPPAGMMWDAGWNVTADTYRVLGDVGAKVVCSLRRSSFDRALSKAVQVAFHAACGVSNAVLESERACLRSLQRRGVSLDVALVVRVMREAELAAQFNRAVCEAQVRRAAAASAAAARASPLPPHCALAHPTDSHRARRRRGRPSSSSGTRTCCATPSPPSMRSSASSASSLGGSRRARSGSSPRASTRPSGSPTSKR